MGYLNKVFIIGRLGAKPEKRFTQNGTSVATMNIATTEYYTDKNSGTKNEKTEWHRVVMWSKLADLADQYLDKGSEVFIEGKLQTREWTDKDNNRRFTTEIVGLSMQFLGSKAGGSGQPYSPRQDPESRGNFPSPQSQSPGQFGNFGSPAASPPPPTGGSAPAPSPNKPGDAPFIEDDIPF